MFRGAQKLILDDKGRLAIPKGCREDLEKCCQGRLVVTVNNTREKCLWLYPMDEWTVVEQKVVNLPSFDPNHQKLKRFLIGYASVVEIDKTGRILLPPSLREFALLTKSVYLVGQGNKFEIWDAELWNETCTSWQREEPQTGTMSEEMKQISL